MKQLNPEGLKNRLFGVSKIETISKLLPCRHSSPYSKSAHNLFMKHFYCIDTMFSLVSSVWSRTKSITNIEAPPSSCPQRVRHRRTRPRRGRRCARALRCRPTSAWRRSMSVSPAGATVVLHTPGSRYNMRRCSGWRQSGRATQATRGGCTRVLLGCEARQRCARAAQHWRRGWRGRLPRCRARTSAASPTRPSCTALRRASRRSRSVATPSPSSSAPSTRRVSAVAEFDRHPVPNPQLLYLNDYF